MKKRGSRWLAFLLAVVLSVTMIPICTVSAKDFENASALENEASEYKPEAEQTDELVELQSDDREVGNLILYSGHLQSYGDMASVADWAVLGTTGQAKRLEAIRISKGENIADVDGSIMYRVHVQSYGTQDWVADGALAGTTGQAKRIEAIQIRLTGDLSEQYDIYYAVHVQKYGWTKWTRGLAEGDSTDGSAGWCGTIGLSLRVEAIRIVLVEKNGTVPTNDGSWSYLTGSDMGSIVYSGHQQTYGNLTAVSNGTTL